MVDRTPDQTWAKIGPYCAIAQWLKVTCVITAGNGVSVGSNRLLNGNNNEIMIAATPYSYSYTQPSTTILYHGTLAVEPLDRGRKTKIVYTLFYDQAPLGTDQAKAENRAQRTKRFDEALDAMKAMAESALMIDILQLVPLRPEVQKELAARYRLHGKADFDKVAGIVRGCVTNGHSGPPPDMIDRMPKLEIIASASVGYDGIPVEYARSKGIPVTNTPEVLNDDVADLAIGLMIMTARRLVVTDRYVRSRPLAEGRRISARATARQRQAGGHSGHGPHRQGDRQARRGDEQQDRLSQPPPCRRCDLSILSQPGGVGEEQRLPDRDHSFHAPDAEDRQQRGDRGAGPERHPGQCGARRGGG